MAPRFNRYERVYHTARRQYCHLTMPGPNAMTVMAHFGDGIAAVPVLRDQVRRLRWWERLLNR